MSAEGKKIAVGVFCSDWRLHQEGVHINNAVAKYLGVDGVDVIALPGPDGVCVVDSRQVEQGIVADWLKVLVGAHKPVALVFMPHYNCAGHPVSDEEHDKGAQEMLEYYQKATGFTGEYVALNAVFHDDTNWTIKEIARIPAAH